MIDKKYLTKEIVPEYDVKKKKVAIAIHPSGHQYNVNDLKEFLRVRGIDSKKSAEKQGWRFK